MAEINITGNAGQTAQIDTQKGTMNVSFLNSTGGAGGNANHVKEVPIGIKLGDFLTIQLGSPPADIACRINNKAVDVKAEADRTLHDGDRVNVSSKNIQGG